MAHLVYTGLSDKNHEHLAAGRLVCTLKNMAVKLANVFSTLGRLCV